MMRRFIDFTSLTIGIALAIGAGSIAANRPQEPTASQGRFAERVDVGRILIDTRVVDDAGSPVLGLNAGDFEVTIDGAPVRVESAEWIGEQSSSSNEPLPSTGPVGVVGPPAPGRLIVFLIQKDLTPVRAKGLMRWPQINGPLLASLTGADRVAVLSFDSHLRYWLDFTSDVERVRAVLAQDVLFKNPAPLARGPEPSLLARLTPAQGRAAATIEEALRLIGRALEPLPGSKSIVLVGYGFGRLTGTGESAMMPEYDAARIALQAARATLLCLDVSFADFHSFAAGLGTVAADTGGIVGSVYVSPRETVDRVVHALAGYYVLSAEKPAAEKGVHRIVVRLRQTKGTVLARRSYTEP
jgi:VWFA-related protein